MTLSEIVDLLEGTVITGLNRIDENVEYAFSSDLMSDVLTIKIENFLLITGLVNNQSIRTAEMSDIQYIIYVRDKQITEEMLELAEENEMVIISTPYSMFKTSGILYGAGLFPVY